ncbi:MAG: hypothetical protein Q9210_007295 [Variospora velana]
MATPRMGNSIARKSVTRLDVSAPPPRHASRKPYSTSDEKPTPAATRSKTTFEEFCQGCLIGGLVGTAYAVGYNKFDDWNRNRRKLQNEEQNRGSEPTKFESDWKKKSGQKSKEDFETRFKDVETRFKDFETRFQNFETKLQDFDPRMVRGQIRDLQKQARKMDPEYRPDERGYVGLWRLVMDLRAAGDVTSKSTGRNTKSTMDPALQPKKRSTDLVKRFAAMCKVPERKKGLRKAWEWLLPYEQEDVREMVRDRMGVYGITCPKTGNPFGDDADDKEDYLEDYGDE